MIAEGPKLDGHKVALVYSMHHHLGDFVVMGGLLKKLDLLGVPFTSLVAHRGSPHVEHFDGEVRDRFFDVTAPLDPLRLVGKLRRLKQEGHVILGVPMAPGSLQAFAFFRLLKGLGALSYVVDFNLGNADVITPPRRRYIFDRHLAQAAEIFKQPQWLEDLAMPLAIPTPPATRSSPALRIGFFPWSGRGHLPEFQWPIAKWRELARLLLEGGDSQVVVPGRSDELATWAASLREGLPETVQQRIVEMRTDSPPALAAALFTLDALVTLNTSALHLAHALRLPTVALCGSSLELWLPEGPHIRIVCDPGGALPPSDKYVHDPLQPSVGRIEVGRVRDALVAFPKMERLLR